MKRLDYSYSWHHTALGLVEFSLAPHICEDVIQLRKYIGCGETTNLLGHKASATYINHNKNAPSERISPHCTGVQGAQCGMSFFCT